MLSIVYVSYHCPKCLRLLVYEGFHSTEDLTSDYALNSKILCVTCGERIKLKDMSITC